jgi:hypothetical protein
VSVVLAAPHPKARAICALTVYQWLKEVYGPDAWEYGVCDSFREAAVRGAEYALSHLSAGQGFVERTVVIEKIHFHLADTIPAAVAYAACHATWRAFGVTAEVMPVFEDGKLTFPGVSN